MNVEGGCRMVGFGKAGVVQINLRCVPLSLRQRLKVEAKGRGKGLEAFCVEVLEKAMGGGGTGGAGGETISGGNSILGRPVARVPFWWKDEGVVSGQR